MALPISLVAQANIRVLLRVLAHPKRWVVGNGKTARSVQQREKRVRSGWVGGLCKSQRFYGK